MRIALCNEVIAPMPFPKQCEYAAKLGYDGLEIAPYTLSDEPHRLGARAARRRAQRGRRTPASRHRPALAAGQARRAVDQHPGRCASGSGPLDVMLALIDQCAELGGRYLVHGSPQQRRVDSGRHARCGAGARAGVASPRSPSALQKAGVIYCIEPLSSDQTPLDQHARGGRRRW